MMKKRAVLTLVIGIAAVVIGAGNASAVEYKLDRFYYDAGTTQYDYNFDSSDSADPYFVSYPEYFDATGTSSSREFSNIPHPEHSTVNNDDVKPGGYLELVEEDAYEDEGETVIGVNAAHYIPGDIDGMIAAYFLGTDEDLAGNQFIDIMLYGMSTEAALSFGFDEQSGEYKFMFFSSEMGEEEDVIIDPDTTITTWTDEILAMRLDIDVDGTGTATMSGYYYFGSSSPDPTVTTGWTPLDLSTSNYNVIAAWGDDSHSAEFAASFGQPVPEPSTIVLILLGLGGLYWRRKRKKLA